ncbi:LRP2 [Mytilus coruscus]|uniref:LRP2 n=1 Tax=Mytilus coruscus TaxID=42192 RepID=A0A6J8BHA2_MYTCO|nr:LRP2 [Mytilus coruscus]
MYIGYYTTGISKSRFDLTDINMIVNFTSSIRKAHCMDIDLTEQRLYWMNDDGDIKSVNVDGSDVKTIISTNWAFYYYYAIGVMGSYIYYTNNNQLVMINKTQGSKPTGIYNGTSGIYSIYAFDSSDVQTVTLYGIMLIITLYKVEEIAKCSAFFICEYKDKRTEFRKEIKHCSLNLVA